MDILQLIDRLEELFNDAKAVAFTHNVVVDEDRMLELMDQMRIAITEEVKKSQEAQRRAEQIISQARAEAEAIRADADNYVLDTLMQLQDQIAKLSNQVNN